MKIINTLIVLIGLFNANLWAGTEIKDEWGRKVGGGEFESIASDGGTNPTETEVMQTVYHTCWVTFSFYIQNCDFVGTTTATKDNEVSSDYLDQSESGETPGFDGAVQVQLVGYPSYHSYGQGYWYKSYSSEINSHQYVWAMDYITQGSGHWDDTPYTAYGSTIPTPDFP